MLEVAEEREKSPGNFQVWVHPQCRVFFSLELAPELLRMPNDIYITLEIIAFAWKSKFRDHDFSVNVWSEGAEVVFILLFFFLIFDFYIFSVCLVFFCFKLLIWSEKKPECWCVAFDWGGLGLPVAVSGQMVGFSNIQFWLVAFGTEFWVTVKIVVFGKHKRNLERRFSSGRATERVWFLRHSCLQRMQLSNLLLTFPDSKSK